MHLRKDRSLDELATIGNVAQFVSFDPGERGPEQAFLRILGVSPHRRFGTPRAAVAELMLRSAENSVNIRSYTPESPRSREFIYGLTDVDVVMRELERLSGEGLHTIVNETIDIHDGGVSGVAQPGIIEFAPDDTPRCVEKGGVASLPFSAGMRLLETVYGFRPELDAISGRVEFSIHPRPRGWKGTRTLLWEHEGQSESATPTGTWPNRFSRHLGDKLYGLLMADLAEVPVPRTLAICRRVAPFAFGRSTGSPDTWIRTCPVQQEPGLFTTKKGWLDPFRLMTEEDPDGTRIASVLAQAGVAARHSGASIVDAEDRTVVEGVAGDGDLFMLGRRMPEPLPDDVIADVLATSDRLRAAYGPVRTEWVHDGSTTWIVQLHLGATETTSQVLVPGEAERWVGFPVSQGLEGLRSLLRDLDSNSGVHLVGEVGVTSHLADLARKSGIPTRVVPA